MGKEERGRNEGSDHDVSFYLFLYVVMGHDSFPGSARG